MFQLEQIEINFQGIAILFTISVVIYYQSASDDSNPDFQSQDFKC